MQASSRALGTAYVLDHPIGWGATGEVWRGHERETGAPVAAKLLRPDLANDPEVVARFVRERTILVALHHPNLVAVRDLVAEGSSVAIVMDLVDGGDLRGRLAAQGPMAPGELCRIMSQVMAGLAAIHAAGVIHRDVKPENVLVDLSSGLPRARISDFGIAWAADGAQITGSSRLPGTTAYLAPEVIEGRSAGPPVDIYAAGVMAYELASGRRPFTADSALAVLRLHVDQAPAPPAGMPVALWGLVAACLRKDPRDRPTAARMARAFTRLAPKLAGAEAVPAPVDADPSETPTLWPAQGGGRRLRWSLARPTPSRRLVATAMAGVLALGAVTSVAALVGGDGAGGDPDDPGGARPAEPARTSPSATTGAVVAGPAPTLTSIPPEAVSTATPTVPADGAPIVLPEGPAGVPRPGPSPPTGSAPRPGLAAVDASAYRLAAGESFVRLAPWVAQLRTRMESATVAGLLETADRAARPLCLPTSTPAVGFCWDEEDHRTTRWSPIGVSGSADAWPGGRHDGHQALLVAWADRRDGGGVRVSFVRRDEGSPVRYQHVLLVEPTSGSDYRAIPANGVSGLVWFENRLYVADAQAGLRVFDVRELWRVAGDDATAVGRGSDGRYHAAGNRYVLSQVGAFTPPGDGVCRRTATVPAAPAASSLCSSFAGLDRTTSPPSLITGERLATSPGARLLRWPLAGAGLSSSTAETVESTGAWRSDHPDLGGVAAFGDTIVTNSVSTDPALWLERPDRTTAEVAFPGGARGLSLAPATGQLWSAIEEPGRRAVLAVPVKP